MLKYATEFPKVTTYPGMNVSEQDEKVDGYPSSVRGVIDVALTEMPREILLLVSQARARAVTNINTHFYVKKGGKDIAKPMLFSILYHKKSFLIHIKSTILLFSTFSALL
jgi:hypothetical protein